MSMFAVDQRERPIALPRQRHGVEVAHTCTGALLPSPSRELDHTAVAINLTGIRENSS